MTDQNSKGSGNDFDWIKPAVTPKPKTDLRKENPMLYFMIQRNKKETQEKDRKEKQENEKMKKQAPKRLNTQVTIINGYLLQLKQALQKENQQFAINWSSIKTESISNLRFSYFNDIAGWDEHKDGQHDFEGPVDIQDQPRAHGALQDTLYKTTVCKTCNLTLNNKKWQITVYPGLFDGRLAVFTPTGVCQTIDQVKTNLQPYIEKILQETAR